MSLNNGDIAILFLEPRSPDCFLLLLEVSLDAVELLRVGRSLIDRRHKLLDTPRRQFELVILLGFLLALVISA